MFLLVLFPLFVSWENSFSKGPDFLQQLSATNHQYIVMLHLNANVKTQRLLGLGLTAQDYFLSPSTILTDASLIGKMQSVQVVLAMWLNILSCCTIMLTLLYRERRGEKIPEVLLWFRQPLKQFPFLVGCGKRLYRDGHPRAGQLVWLRQWSGRKPMSYCRPNCPQTELFFFLPAFWCTRRRERTAEFCLWKLDALMDRDYHKMGEEEMGRHYPFSFKTFQGWI